MKQRLLSEADLQFDEAVSIISSVKAAEKNAASLIMQNSNEYGRRLQHCC